MRSFILMGVSIIVFVILMISDRNDRKENLNGLIIFYKILYEDTYAKGQADAIKGDIRINQINDSTWVYVKSPWDGGMKLITDTIIIKQ
jgi:hypothetical protein